MNSFYLLSFILFRPEAQGVLCGAVYLICMFLFIPFPFYDKYLLGPKGVFPHHEVRLSVSLHADSLQSICHCLLNHGHTTTTCSTILVEINTSIDMVLGFELLNNQVITKTMIIVCFSL